MKRNKSICLTEWFSLLKTEAGSSVVEYAIVFILLMTMLLAIADFSRAVYAYHFVSSAAREAARYASVRGSTCHNDNSCTTANDASGVAGPFATKPPAITDIQDFVKRVPKGIDSTKLTINPTWANCTPFNLPGCTVTVQVSYVFSFFSPLVSKNNLTFSSTSQEIITH